MIPIKNDLETFSRAKLTVRNALEGLHKTVSHFDGRGNELFVEQIAQIIERLKSGSFKILVVGEFSTGKSTFLNALIGSKFLPTETTETTATINIIKYGEKPSAIIHFWGTRDELGKEISNGESQAIKLADLARYVTSITKESNEIAKTVKYVELLLPSDYCRNGVELVDTPGLNTTYGYHETTTLEYLQNGNFGIMLLSGTQFLSASEVEYLGRFKKSMNKVMFVVNYVNQMPPDDSFDDNREYFQQKLKKVLGSEHEITVYPLDALLAEKGDWKNSGLEGFLAEFEAFLTSDEKGKEMLFPPILQATTIINTLIKNNNLTASGISFSPIEFERKVDELSTRLELIKSQQRELIAYLEQKSGVLVQRYSTFAKEQFHKKALQIKNEVAGWPGDIQSIREDLPGYLKTHVIETSMLIQDYIQKEMGSVLHEARTRYDDLLEEISNYQDTLLSSLQPDESVTAMSPSNLGTIDFKDSDISDLALQFGGSFAIGYIVAAIISGPIGWIAAMLGSGMLGKVINEKANQRKFGELAERVYIALNQAFEKGIPEGSDLIRQRVASEISELNRQFANQLASVQSAIDSIRVEMFAEEKEVIERRERYEHFNAELASIQIALNEVAYKMHEG